MDPREQTREINTGFVVVGGRNSANWSEAVDLSRAAQLQKALNLKHRGPQQKPCCSEKRGLVPSTVYSDCGFYSLDKGTGPQGGLAD